VGRAADAVSLTYGQLEYRARHLAARLAHEVQPGQRGLLLFPPGIDFMIGFLACQYARVVPVPTCFPKPGRSMPRLDAAAEDCAPTVLLGDRATLDGVDLNRVSPDVAAATMLATDSDENPGGGPDADWQPDWEAIRQSDLALLQYTSGSTSDPKGVMVSHGNLLSNLEAIRQAFGIEWAADDSDEISRGVFWLPPFHDMGLIGGILEAIYVGGHTTLMSPRTFLHRPMRWLESISRFRANISGAPNFAYQLCLDRSDPDDLAGLDLSGWDLAFCGAEPISADTLEAFARRFKPNGFRASSYCPCYGLAEATLLAAGGSGSLGAPLLYVDRDALATGSAVVLDTDESVLVSTDTSAAASKTTPSEQRRLVSCGEPGAGMTLRIVDPVSLRGVPEGQVGEIWLQGPSVTSGYWQREELNARQFQAFIAEEPHAGEFCRTGDLGFLHENRLFVTGRCKDVIILRGRNLYPQDLEATVKAAIEEIRQVVAVAIEGPQGDALAIVAEVSRHLDEEQMPDLVRQLRRTVIEEHEVDARCVVLTRPAAIPLTTSGKVQRQACRGMLERDELPVRYRWSRSVVSDETGSVTLPELPTRVDPDAIEDGAEQIEAWLLAWLVLRGGVASDQVHRDTPFADYGLDSLAAVELSAELEDWLGIELTPVLAWNYPTPKRLGRHLAMQMAGIDESVEAEATDLDPCLNHNGLDEDVAIEDFESLLSEVEQLSDDEID